MMGVMLLGCLLSGYPVAFTLGGGSVIIAFLAAWIGVFNLNQLGSMFELIFGVMNNRPLLAVPLFVFMGLVLERSKVAEELLSTMGRLFGFMPGGLAVSVCIVGALLAASTGIVGATVVTMGLLSLPTMLKAGYNKELATGTIAASGTLGQLIPPSIVLIILGEQLTSAYDLATRKEGYPCEPISEWVAGCAELDTMNTDLLFLGAMVPGLVLVGLYIVYVLLIAFARPSMAPAARQRGESDPTLLRDVLVALVPPLLLIVAVLGSILIGIASPTEAASLGCLIAMLIAATKLMDGAGRWVPLLGIFSFVGVVVLKIMGTSLGNDTGPLFILTMGKQESGLDWAMFYLSVGMFFVGYLSVAVAAIFLLFKRAEDLSGNKSKNSILVDVMTGTVKVTAMVFIILVGARVLTTVFTSLGGSLLVEHFLLSLQGGWLAQLLVVMLVMFILGFFLDFIEISFIVVPIVAPILLFSQGLAEPISPIWLGVLFAMNLQTSFLTPPFGFALFYLRGVAPPEVKTGHIYRGVIPFVAIQIVGLVILYFVPELATWLPDAAQVWRAGGA